MKSYQQRLVYLIAESGALFFSKGLKLKDGRNTPYFINLGALSTGRFVLELGDCFAEWIIDQGLHHHIDVLLGPSYKGSAIAQAIAIALYQRNGVNLTFDYDRKETKVHGEVSDKGSTFVTGRALINGARVLVVDDVCTSMATKNELLKKIKEEQTKLGVKIELKGVVLAVDREQTQAVYDEHGKVIEGACGVDALIAFIAQTGLSVWSILGIRMIVEILIANRVPVLVDGIRKPFNEALLKQVWNYLTIYGRK